MKSLFLSANKYSKNLKSSSFTDSKKNYNYRLFFFMTNFIYCVNFLYFIIFFDVNNNPLPKFNSLFNV